MLLKVGKFETLVPSVSRGLERHGQEGGKMVARSRSLLGPPTVGLRIDWRYARDHPRPVQAWGRVGMPHDAH